MIAYEFTVGWLIARLNLSDRGANLVEYSLLISLIAIVCISAVSFFSRGVSSRYSTITSSIK